MQAVELDLSSIDFGEAVTVQANGGSATYGNTVISWTPSTTSASVTVSITVGGTVVQQQPLTPTSNTMSYNAVSGQDSAKGQIKASFGPSGTSGQLYGVLSWVYQQGSGQYTGSIGFWGS